MTRQEHIDGYRKAKQIEDEKRRKEYNKKIEEEYKKMIAKLEDKRR